MCFAPQRRAIFGHREPSKSGPNMWCFAHFDLQMCFAPQRRAIFEHRNFQNGSDNVVFCTFWLANVLRATAACNFSNIELPKWLRECGVLCILTCKCASRHSGVPFFEHRNFQNGSANEVFCTFWLANVLRATAACHFSPVCLNSYLRTRRFSEATFRTSGTTNHWKNTAIRDVPNIFHTHVTFFLLTLHACWSSFCWLDICCLLDTSTLLFNSAYCRKLDFPSTNWSLYINSLSTIKSKVSGKYKQIRDMIWQLWFTTTNLSYRFPIRETSASTSSGTTGIWCVVQVKPNGLHPFFCWTRISTTLEDNSRISRKGCTTYSLYTWRAPPAHHN